MIEIYDLNKENKYNTVQFNNLKSRSFYAIFWSLLGVK